MNDFATNLKKIMREKNMRQIDVANKSGISKGRVSRWMSGENIPYGESLAKLAEALGVSVDRLLGKTDPIERFIKGDTTEDVELPFSLETLVPVLGTVAAGVPIEAQEDVVGEIPVLDKQGGFFALKVKGDSMSPRIMDGDIVLVKPQDFAEDGDLVIALVDGEATCKILKRSHDAVSLVPFNAAYLPFVYTGSDAEGMRILGKVVESRHEW